MRPKPLLQLLQSVAEQTKYPDEILIVDGSTNTETELVLKENQFKNLNYFLVSSENRGLTKQRNFGIERVGAEIEILAFLDDDTKLTSNYFEILIQTYSENNTVFGVGGIAVNESKWSLVQPNLKYNKKHYFEFDGFVRKEGLRNVFRNYLGLQSNLAPGRMPDYSHGKTCGFPMNGKIYEVDLLVGMSFSFRKKVFDEIRFSTYFEGYGLYEDADFSIRALQFGKNVINTNLQLSHYHNPSGRPNQYQYGKMVVRNGWYVWRVKNPKPTLDAKIKWNLITILLTMIRFSNTFTSSKKKQAFTESIGRIVGWWSLIFSKPKMQ
jgi:GT2 family glycosyltransferase